MGEIELPYRFEPRAYQCPIMEAVIERGVKRAVACWHRRAGKDKTFLNIMAIMAMQRMGNYAYFFPTAVLGRKAMWDNIDANSGMRVIDHLPKGLVKKRNEQQMKLTLANDSTIQILGTETLDVVGGNPIGCVFSESAQHNPLAWDYVRPILAENGGWCIFNGTPRGRNWFYRLIEANRQNPAWHVEVRDIENTGALGLEVIEEERRAGMREEMIRQEYYCDFNVGLVGAIYADLLSALRNQGRFTGAPLWDRGSLVWTFWDLGGMEHTAIWYAQFIGGEIRIIDYDGGQRLGNAERIGRMLAKPYAYGGHLLPHDAEASKVGEISWLGELSKLGLQGLRVIPRTHDPFHGINRMRELLPACWFASPACDAGIEALENYHLREHKDGYVKNEIVHDWSSHAADAFRYIGEALLHGMVKVVGLAGSHEPRLDPWTGERLNRRGERRGMKPMRVG